MLLTGENRKYFEKSPSRRHFTRKIRIRTALGLNVEFHSENRMTSCPKNCTASKAYYKKKTSVSSLSLCASNLVNLAGAATEVVGNFFDTGVWCVVCLHALTVTSIRPRETSRQEGK
jgi:hypothetical protein